MLLMVQKVIRGEMYSEEKSEVMHRYAEANNKHLSNHNNNKKESSYIQYLDANYLYGWAMSQTKPINGFEWVEDISIINNKK